MPVGPEVTRPRTAGVTSILVATVVAGAAGYGLTWVVYRSAGPASYAGFAVFWAALYFVVGAVAGIQQEIARASRPRDDGEPVDRARPAVFATAVSLILIAAVLATSPLWAHAVFGEHGELAVPLAIGVGGYALVATVAGLLYGVSQWRSIAAMIVVDAILRLALVLIALLVHGDVTLLAWAVAVPFPLALIVLWPFIRRGVVGRVQLDVRYRALLANVLRTLLASASTALLVSGFPILIGVITRDDPAELVGELIFTLTLTRAPLMVTVMALQSYLVVLFRDTPGRVARRLLLAIGGAAVTLGALGWWLGPPVLTWVSGHATSLGGGVIASMVFSSALIAGLTVSGAALLASSRHQAYAAGWLCAAVVTVLAISLPIGLVERAVVAMIAGPATGIVVHVLTLARGRARRGHA